ncbi:MAG: hypothetical protein KC983_08565 [Phycisphaerales bacterium]|nr:hypothetical protein [Phycisphaerales bacterium]
MKVSRSAAIGLFAGLMGVMSVDAVGAPRGMVIGACCVDGGSACVDVDVIDDAAGYCVGELGGVYLGDGTECAIDSCVGSVVTGACCFFAATAGPVDCQELTEDDCVSSGGTYDGDDSFCAPPLGETGTSCEIVIPIGACCIAVQPVEEVLQCIEMDAIACAFAGGEYFGDDSTCEIPDVSSGVNCNTVATGSCCFANGQCHEIVLELACLEAGGAFSEALCSTYLCVPENDDCTSATALMAPFPIQVGGALDDASPDALPCFASVNEDELAAQSNGLTASSVWFTVVGTGSPMSATLCGNFDIDEDPILWYDFQISVYCGSCFNLNCVTADDDSCSDYLTVGPGLPNGFVGLPYANWCSEKGATYYIQVSGIPVDTDDTGLGGPMGGLGNFDLTVDSDGKPCEADSICEPQIAGADFCDSFEGSICTDIIYSENNFDATNNLEIIGGNFQLDVMHCGVWFGFYDNWYVYRPAWDGQVFFNVYGVNNPTLEWVFAIYPTCEANEDQQLACNELQHATIFMDVKRGEEYYLRVAARGYERGEYEVELTGPDCAPDPSDLDNSGVPDIQECIEDVNNDGYVDFADFVQVIVAFNQCLDCCCDPVEDVDGDTHVDPADALIVYNAIGRVCPAPLSMQSFISGRRPTDAPKGTDAGAALTVRP